MKAVYKTVVFIVVMLVAGCSFLRMTELDKKYGKAAPVSRRIEHPEPGGVSYHKDVQPILEKRCDVCHSCYDAPCQLKTTSFDGIDRGGTQKLVYDTSRIRAVDPTRLFIDASTTEEWRDKDFHPVLNERIQTPDANVENSLIYKMLELKKNNPLPETELLSETFDLRLDHNYICTTIEDFPEFAAKYPLWGMPYALPGLDEDEYRTIIEWLRQGAGITPAEKMSEKAETLVTKWERFLNGSSLKERLMSRYLYEHLFIGRIHFDGLPDREFYRLVRSETPPGQPVVEINTLRPYDDPGVDRFYYRLRRLESTVVVKDHTVYHIGAGKMDRYRELFLQSDYEVARLPSYDRKTTANPFRTFAAIPPVSRYRFMLDDASYFVMGFIKGPVCRGQVALNVVNDHFFVAFTDPEKDTVSNDAAFLESVSDYLRIPSEKKSNIKVLSVWHKYRRLQKKYLDERNRHLAGHDPAGRGRGIDYIWDGGQVNDNVLLTVFRHFDSASVVKGFVGKTPKTAWVVDYPLFERIHYLLVAGFNVYGNLGHQAESRLYMDSLRMEGESNFLSFLPRDCREAIWDHWYEDARRESRHYLARQFYGLERETAVAFHTGDPKAEFIHMLMAHAGPATLQHDCLNRCSGDAFCMTENAGPLEREADRQMRRIGNMHGSRLKPLPDVAFLHVVMDGKEKDQVYTIIRNKALSNNSMMFRENHRRRLDHDSLTIVKGYVGSYPNAFYRVPVDQLASCVDEYLAVKDAIGYYRLARNYSIQRNCPCFWQEADWHNRTFLEMHPVEGGLFDMYRFHRIGEDADAEKFEW